MEWPWHVGLGVTIFSLPLLFEDVFSDCLLYGSAFCCGVLFHSIPMLSLYHPAVSCLALPLDMVLIRRSPGRIYVCSSYTART